MVVPSTQHTLNHQTISPSKLLSQKLANTNVRVLLDPFFKRRNLPYASIISKSGDIAVVNRDRLQSLLTEVLVLKMNTTP